MRLVSRLVSSGVVNAAAVLGAIAAAACGPAASESPRNASERASPKAAAPSSSAPPASPGALTEERFCAIGDALVAKRDAEMTEALTKDLGPDEVDALLYRFTPGGSREDMQAIMNAAGVRPEDVAAFLSAHPAEADRCSERFTERLGAVVRRAEPLVQGAKKKLVAWRFDVAQARADAKQQNKPAIVFFCAAWATACADMDKTLFRDADVRRLLGDDVVPIRIDATDDTDPEVHRLQNEYKVPGVPALVVFDAKGKEKRRFDSAPDKAALTSVLRDVAPSSPSPAGPGTKPSPSATPKTK